MKALVTDPRDLAASMALAGTGSAAQTSIAIATLAACGRIGDLDLAPVFIRSTKALKASPQPASAVRRLIKVLRQAFARVPSAHAQRPRIAVELLKNNISGLQETDPVPSALTERPDWDNDPVLWDLVRQWIVEFPEDGYACWKSISMAMRPNGLGRDHRIAALETALRSVYRFHMRASASNTAAAREQSPYGLLRALIVIDQRANDRSSLVPKWSSVMRGVLQRPEPDAAKRIAGYRAQADRSKIGVYVGEIDSLTAKYFAPAIITGLLRAGLTVRIYTQSAPPVVEGSFLHRQIVGHDVSFAILRTVDEQEIALRVAADRNWAYLDLRGHSHNHLIDVLAARPAPLSIHMIGGGETCGVEGVDALVTDAHVLPANSDFISERHVVRLAGGIFNMATFDLPARPSVRTGSAKPVFGAFHEDIKISSISLDLWADALKASPDSRIHVKPNSPRINDVSTWALRGLQARGIAEHRITILRHAPTRDGHLEMLNGIDVMLDAAPFNGETTTIEALWMGVPVVSVAGDRMIARYGASILHHAGHPELCARTRQEFAGVAASVIQDTEFLTRFRTDGRSALMASPTFDSDRYADSVVDAVKELWALPTDPE